MADSPLSTLGFISVHLLTCPARAPSCAATLARWEATDWGKAHGRPTLHFDHAPEESDAPWGAASRGVRIVTAFARMLEAAITTRGCSADQQRQRKARRGGPSLVLLLEDDLDFHPRIGAALAAWPALDRITMATLFNPQLSPLPGSSFILPPFSFAADPKTFLGAQALLLNRSFARLALAHWHEVTGMQSQRLAQLHQRYLAEHPIRVHRPSLVQHLPVAGGSGWGARVQQALDFDPAWEE